MRHEESCKAKKSVRTEQTWYFPARFCKGKHLTLRISMFLTETELPPPQTSTSLLPPRVSQDFSEQYHSQKTFPLSWTSSSFPDTTFSSCNTIRKYSPFCCCFGCFGVWLWFCLLGGFLFRFCGVFLSEETCPREIPAVLLRHLLL